MRLMVGFLREATRSAEVIVADHVTALFTESMVRRPSFPTTSKQSFEFGQRRARA